MPPFLKGFAITLLIQMSVLAILAIGFFAGGSQANPLRALIAFLGIAVFALCASIGIKSAQGVAALIFAVVCSISLVSGWMAGLKNDSNNT
jgi:hypothetical protein